MTCNPPITLAVIPARGGSKGLPGKNLAKIGARSLLGWAAKAARDSNCITRLVVSTDSNEIASHAQQNHAEVPFLRPPELSTDSASGTDVVLHCLAFLRDQEGFHPDWILVLQPTSPLRTSRDIEQSFALTRSDTCDAVVSVTAPLHHPYLSQVVDANGFLKPLFPNRLVRRQELPSVYQPNGAIYWIRTATLLQERTFYPKRCLGYIMPAERSVDIDTPFDLKLAKFLQDSEQSLSHDSD